MSAPNTREGIDVFPQKNGPQTSCSGVPVFQDGPNGTRNTGTRRFEGIFFRNTTESLARNRERFLPRLWLGPPGCGKTWRAIEQFTLELGRSVPPDRIALVTFTRASREEARQRALQRFQLPPSRLTWVRTIHSAAFRLLQLGHGEILDDKRMTEFGRRHGYKLTVDGRRVDDDTDRGLTLGRTADDRMLFAFDWGRNHGLDLEETLARCPVDDLSAPQFRLFVRRLEEFKREHGLLDFSDLLLKVLEQGLRPDVDVAMVDEAHDLSPLQIAVIELWFAPCERAFVCADDDQAIFGWHGATPEWIQSLAQRCQCEVLEQSYRVPRAAHELAMRIIERNKVRTPKVYRPADREGCIVTCSLDQALDRVQQSSNAFVLVRNRVSIRPVAEALVERAVPFTVEGWGGASPLDDHRAVRAVNLVLRLNSEVDGPFSAAGLSALAALVPTTTGLVPTSTTERLRAMKGQGSFTRAQLEGELGLVDLLRRIEATGVNVLAKLSRAWRLYFERIEKHLGLLPDPTTTVTTIHVAKGSERDLVVVIPDMTRPTYAAYLRGGAERNEAENRVFYVAVTRTRETLVLVQPKSRRHYEFPHVRAPRVDGVETGARADRGGA